LPHISHVLAIKKPPMGSDLLLEESRRLYP